MDLLLVRSLWGVEAPWREALPAFRAAGYGAVEAPLPPPGEDERLADLAAHHGLAFVPMVFTEGATPGEHRASFEAQLARAAALGPLLVTSHSGRDGWSEDDADAFFAHALALEAALGVDVAHETHRGRLLYTPWTTARALAAHPALRLCCDFSHWVCVCERLLDDQSAALALAATRCLHLHARVGFEEGPQVPDPRAARYAAHLAAHEAWWDGVWDAQAARGAVRTTLTPEYGPPPYLHTDPRTGAPLANLAEVCNWQAARAARRFAARPR